MGKAAVAPAAKDLVSQHLAQQEFAPNLVGLMQLAKRETGKSELAQAKELMRLRRGIGHLAVDEYFMYRLYDDRLYSDETRDAFLSEKLHWPICAKCADPQWRATTEDKWLAYLLLAQFGQRVPRTLAVVDGSQRSFATTPKLSSAADLAGFLATAPLPIFAKPNAELGSFGAILIKRFEGGRITIDEDRSFTPEEMMRDIFGARTYLLQEVVRNHPDIARLSDYVATVRTMNLVWPDRIETPFTLVKIPVGDNIADNYWRKGNLIADVDPETGIIRRAVSGKGAELKLHETHPLTGAPLVGMQLPFWRELRAANEACARAYAPVRYQSLDIALTPEGPAIIEINSGGSFMLAQIASGRGFLTPSVRKFFEASGWDFKKRR
ncbi:MAG TPA: sugar-transfer associated ATP-grasp domain-containing protein [Alphaproteobacteria bacterium]|nr:sugar-transfer associated ATP-grasp domain-containing protein [Alphaproteobacteria bacterium]